MSSSTDSVAAPRARRSILANGLIAAVVAAVVNLIIAAIARAAGVSMTVDSRGEHMVVGISSVIVVTVAVLGIAAIVVWLIARQRPGARRMFAWIGVVFALVSLAAPITAAVDTATAVILASMHVVAGFFWFVALLTAR